MKSQIFKSEKGVRELSLTWDRTQIASMIEAGWTLLGHVELDRDQVYFAKFAPVQRGNSTIIFSNTELPVKEIRCVTGYMSANELLRDGWELAEIRNIVKADKWWDEFWLVRRVGIREIPTIDQQFRGLAEKIAALEVEIKNLSRGDEKKERDVSEEENGIMPEKPVPISNEMVLEMIRSAAKKYGVSSTPGKQQNILDTRNFSRADEAKLKDNIDRYFHSVRLGKDLRIVAEKAGKPISFETEVAKMVRPILNKEKTFDEVLAEWLKPPESNAPKPEPVKPPTPPITVDQTIATGEKGIGTPNDPVEELIEKHNGGQKDNTCKKCGGDRGKAKEICHECRKSNSGRTRRTKSPKE